jgi:hypothetical protein
METNKTGKYLKYAIGEIVLVVIGILIAIQANNWEIAKKAQKEKEFALHKLIANLNQDITILKGGIEQGKHYISALDSCLIILKNPNAYSKDYFSGLFVYMNYTLNFDFNQITFNEISNSGKLKLIKNGVLTDSLFQYYDTGNYKPVEEAINFHTRDYVRSYTMGYDYLILPHDVDKNLASDFNIETKTLSDYSSDVRIINSIRFKTLLLTSMIERYDELANKASYLITLINEEIKFN